MRDAVWRDQRVNVRECKCVMWDQGYVGASDQARDNLGHAEIIRDLRWSLKLFHDPAIPPSAEDLMKASFNLYIVRVVMIIMHILFRDYKTINIS